MPPAVAGAIIIGAAVVGTTAYQAHETRSAQKKTLAAQAEAIANAEKKSAQAEALAGQQAADKVKKFRLSQTKSILTSPLGVQEESNLGQTSIFGG